MPMVEYFDQELGKMAKKEFAYNAAGKEKARKFMKLQQGKAAVGGYQPPKLKKFAGAGRSSGPDDARHHPGVKIKDKRYPKVKKETKYVEGDPFEFDKKSTVKYSGYEY